MKNFLVILFLLMPIFCGCSSEYRAEKLLWEANEIKKTIVQNPEGSPLGMYQEAREAFEKVVQEYPGTKSAFRAELSIGELYALEGKLDEAAKAFKQVSEKSELVDREFSAQTQIAIAKIEEKKGDWSQALAIYKEALEKYKGVYSVMGTPIYIARYLRNRKETAESEKYYEEAVSYYLKIENENPRSKMSLLASDFRLNCYIDRKMWGEALDLLKSIQENYPGTKEAVYAKILESQINKVVQSSETQKPN